MHIQSLQQSPSFAVELHSGRQWAFGDRLRPARSPPPVKRSSWPSARTRRRVRAARSPGCGTRASLRGDHGLAGQAVGLPRPHRPAAQSGRAACGHVLGRRVQADGAAAGIAHDLEGTRQGEQTGDPDTGRTGPGALPPGQRRWGAAFAEHRLSRHSCRQPGRSPVSRLAACSNGASAGSALQQWGTTGGAASQLVLDASPELRREITDQLHQVMSEVALLRQAVESEVSRVSADKALADGLVKRFGADAEKYLGRQAGWHPQ